jgi:cytoskeletal protein RodZ
MSSTPFGEHLKREREMRGVSLEEISSATRISTRFLAAMENDQWDQLPGGVFNRGFIRSIARYLGLDEDSLVAEYALGTAANEEARAAAQRDAEIPRNWQPAALAFVTILAIAGCVFAAYHYRGWIADRLHKRVSGVGSYNSAPNTAGLPNEPPSAADVAAASASGDQPSSQMLTLSLQAVKAANVKVVADGSTAFDGPLETNEGKQFEAHDTFDVTSSDSGALVLELNGQIVPPSGTPGQPMSVTLTRNDLKAAAGGSH